MRICFLTPEYILCPPYGGIATYTGDAARWLAAHGHDAHVVLVSRTGPHCVEKDAGVTIHSVPTQRIKPRRVLAYLARIPGLALLHEAYAGWNRLEDSVGAWHAVSQLSRLAPFDVVEVADFSGLGFWGTLRRRRPAPILVRSHGYANVGLPGWDRPGARFQLALERRSVRNADFVLAASAERVDHYRAMFSVKPAKIGYLHYGVRVPECLGCDGPAGRDEAPVDVLYVGRVELRKGCDVLFEALKIAHKRQPSIRATIVGPVADDMRQAFADFVEETTSWVRYQGVVPQEQVAAVLREGDLIVLPSRFETLPRILIEALAAGVPQIGSSANGIPEIIEHGATGLVVDPITPDTLAEAILQLGSSAELRVDMSRRSRERALDRFHIDHIMAEQVRVYGALARGEPRLEALST